MEHINKPSESKHDAGLPEWKAASGSSAALTIGERRTGASRAMADDDECVELAVEEASEAKQRAAARGEA